MRPNPELVLRGVAAALVNDVAPEVTTPFGTYVVRMAANLDLFIAAALDGLADRLRTENAAIVSLAAEGAAVVADPALRERLQAASADLDTPDIRVSTLQAANDRLRGLLIELHEAVEGTGGAAARALEERIWEELRESTRRRRLDVVRR